MGSIEEKLNKLPYVITKTMNATCKECIQTYRRDYVYELMIRIEPCGNVYKYAVFYNCMDFIYGDKRKFIGDYSIRFDTLEEAIDNLIKQLPKEEPTNDSEY